MPPPAAAPKIGPNGVMPRAMGNTTGATFLATATTFLTTFPTALPTFLTVFFIFPKSFLKKNSAMPVSGFMLLASEPAM